MQVAVGSMNNPKAWPGLAHFCEHMLFLGTSKYPEEGGFARFIASAGGRNNAYTDSEETVYYFDVNGAALPSALLRFADFFTSPLFTESATAREVGAIDAEHSKNLQTDSWRSNRLLRLRARPEHPYSNFYTGNRATLKNGENGAREALLDFYARYYHAEQMSLVVIGPQTLEQMQQQVVEAFSGVPTGGDALAEASAAYDDLPLPLDPAEQQGKAPVATCIVPVQEQRAATLTWCLPVADFDSFRDSKPATVIGLLLGARGEASLVALLKSEGLGASVSLGVEEATQRFVILSATVGLTKAGLARWPDVVSRVFSYLRVLCERGVPAHVFSDAARSRELTFRFGDPPTVPGAVGALRTYPPLYWVSGPSLMRNGAAGASIVEQMLQRMATPANVLITLIAKELAPEATKVEPIYGTRYGELPISKELREWADPPRFPRLAAPPPNRFMPYSLELKAASIPAAARGNMPMPTPPTLLVSEPAVRLHWLQDRYYARPKAFAYFSLRCPSFYTDPAAALQAELFAALLLDVLQDVAFEAGLAGLGFSVAVTYEGLLIQLGGFDQRLPQLLELVATSARTFPIRPAAFKRKLDGLSRTLRGLDRRQPAALCSYRRNLALQSPRYSNAALLSEAETVTIEQVKAFQAALLTGGAEIEAFVGGNIARGEALSLMSKLRAALPCTPLPVERRPLRRVRRLAATGATQQFVSGNRDDGNSAIEVYFQIGRDTGDEWLYLAVLAQMLNKPFYNELRTRQQLGYIVQCAVGEGEGVRGLSFVVQSTVLSPPDLEIRIEDFLQEVRDTTLAQMSRREFEAYRGAVAAQLGDTDSRLDSQSSRLFAECVRRRCTQRR